MDTEIVNILSQGLWTAARLAGPILGVSLAVGLVVGLLQSVGQIQEPTLTFVPKLAAIALVLIMGGSWMMNVMTDHVEELLARAPELIRQ